MKVFEYLLKLMKYTDNLKAIVVDETNLVPEPTARSAVAGLSPGRGY
jgi:hypothetical protein